MAEMIGPVKLRPRRPLRSDVGSKALVATTVATVLTLAGYLLGGDAPMPRRIATDAVLWFVMFLIVFSIGALVVARRRAAVPPNGVEDRPIQQDPDYVRNDLDDPDHREA
jgi:hypothetical protein